MKGLELTAKCLVRMAKVFVGLSDVYDNEESVKGCYECHDMFKAHVQKLFIKTNMSSEERTLLCQLSRDLRDARIVEIRDLHRDDGVEDEF